MDRCTLIRNSLCCMALILFPSLVGAAEADASFAARRAERLKLLIAPPEPRQSSGAAKHPIDAMIEARWPAGTAGLQAPALCDDATFMRRATLDITGLIPSFTELTTFLNNRSPQKRTQLIDQLLARRTEYAAHWTPFWEDALASQNVTHQGGIPTHGNYREWIMEQFELNRPYDQWVAELLDPAARGRKQAHEDIFGRKFTIDFVRSDTHADTLQTASNIGQVFLGTAMKCASCHDHFENPEWTQERFLGFAGLFAAQDLEKIRCEVHSGQRIAARFPFELPGWEATLPASPAERLSAAARWTVDPTNPRFAKTIVNRLWRRYLGLGLFEPADDYRADTAVSHPELLDWLAYDFLAHGCDLQHTIRLILTSQTYQRRYDAALADHFDVTQRALPRYFRSPALRRLTAEQFVDSVRLASSGQLSPKERLYLDIRATPLVRSLGRLDSRSEVSTARSEDLAVVQTLEWLNGKELFDLIDNSLTFAKPFAKGDLRAVVDRMYRSILSRGATLDEKKAGQAFLTGVEFSEGLRDLAWALVCSPEFIFIK